VSAAKIIFDPATGLSTGDILKMPEFSVAINDSNIVSVTDSRGLIVFANSNFEKISGYSSAELYGKPHSILNSKHHPPEFWKEMWSHIASGQPWQGTVCNRAKNGALYWVASKIVPTYDANGKISGYLSIRRDITEEKNLRDLLGTEQRLQLAVMLAAPVGIFRTDAEGNCIYSNEAWAAMTGKPAEASLGDGWVKAFHPEDRLKVFTAWGDFLTGQSSFKLTWRLLSSTGKIHWVQGTAGSVLNEKGLIDSYIGTAVDITDLIETKRNLELKQAETAAALRTVKLQAEELESAIKAKETFLANMSHEIRTPLNGILGMSEILAGANLEGEPAETIKEILAAGAMLQGVINDILDFSKMEAGQMTVEKRPLSPRNILISLAGMLKSLSTAKGVPIQIKIAPELPALVLGDELRLRQILLNLMSNAVKFSTAGQVTVEASGTPGSPKSGVVGLKFDIIDTGIGISPEQIERLFKPFSQSDDSTTRKYGGTGLGLVIAKRLSQLMGGDVTVKSELGKGSIFTASVMTGSAENYTAAIVEPVLRATSLKNIKVLLAEDNLTNQKLMSMLFKKFGVTFTIANNGKEAFDHACTQKWDLILMDLQMPEMGGLESTRLIRTTPGPSQNCRIVALTANAFDEDKNACINVGMNAFLSKPIQIRNLETALHEAALILENDHEKNPIK
jgi:PAS domain S-box-containing protein